MFTTLQYWTDDDLQQPKGVEEFREGREGILSDLLRATDNQKSLLTEKKNLLPSKGSYINKSFNLIERQHHDSSS